MWSSVGMFEIIGSKVSGLVFNCNCFIFVEGEWSINWLEIGFSGCKDWLVSVGEGDCWSSGDWRSGEPHGDEVAGNEWLVSLFMLAFFHFFSFGRESKM